MMNGGRILRRRNADFVLEKSDTEEEKNQRAGGKFERATESPGAERYQNEDRQHRRQEQERGD